MTDPLGHRTERVLAYKRFLAFDLSLRLFTPLLRAEAESIALQLYTECRSVVAGAQFDETQAKFILGKFHTKSSKINLDNCNLKLFNDEQKGPLEIIKGFYPLDTRAKSFADLDVAALTRILQHCTLSSFPRKELIKLGAKRNELHHIVEPEFSATSWIEISDHLQSIATNVFPSDANILLSLRKLENLEFPSGYDVTEACYLPCKFPLFTGRQIYLDQLQAEVDVYRSASEAVRIALTGLGGLGKSSIALQFGHLLNRMEFPIKWWINGESIATLIQSLCNLCHELGIPVTTDASDEQISNHVKNFLNSCKVAWLLIVDNIGSSTLYSMLPDQNGFILLTSQRKDWPRSVKVVEIERFGEQEAYSMFINFLQPRPIDPFDLPDEILTEINGVPLAIAQAASYLRTVPHMSCAKYLTYFKQKVQVFLDQKGLQIEYRETQSIWATWSLSMDHAEIIAPLGSKYLSLACYFAAENIPDQLFTEYLRLVLPDVIDIDIEMDQLHCIANLSLINHDLTMHSMHRLFQTFIRASKSSFSDLNKALAVLLGHYSVLVKRDLQDEAMENKLAFKALLPHLSMITGFKNAEPRALVSLYMSLAEISFYHVQNFHFAKNSLMTILDISDLHYSEKLRALSLLYRVHLLTHHTVEAARLWDQFFAFVNRFPASTVSSDIFFIEAIEDVHFAFMKGMIGSGDGPSADQLVKFVEELEASTCNHPSRSEKMQLRSAYIRASEGLINQQSLPRKSYSFQLKSIAVSKEIYGDFHYQVQGLQLELAWRDYQAQRFDKSRETLDLCEPFLISYYGHAHHVPAKAMAIRGGLAREDGNLVLSRQLLEKVVPIFQAEYGGSSPKMMWIMKELDLTARALGDMEGIATQRLIETFENVDVIGSSQHCRLVLTYATSLFELCKYSEMKRLCFKVVHSLDILYPQGHRMTIQALEKLVKAFVSEGKYSEGIPFARRAIKLSCNFTGPNSSQTLNAMESLAAVHNSMSQPILSIPLLLSVLLSRNGKDIDESLFEFGRALVKLGLLPQAIVFLQNSLTLKERKFGSESTHIHLVLFLIGVAKLHLHQFAEGAILLRRSLVLHERCVGENHTMLADCLYNVGSCEYALHDLQAAESYLQRSSTLRTQRSGAQHPAVTSAKSMLNNIALARKLCGYFNFELD